MIVIKRNGSEVSFDQNKISVAIYKAMVEVYGDKADKVLADCYASFIVAYINHTIKDKVTVEQIQDVVEDVLMGRDRTLAKAYIRYRYKRELARNTYNELMDELNEKVSGKKIVNQNANIDEKSFGGRVGETSDIVMKRLALDYYVSPMARKNHEENMIYIHDLASYPVGNHNCLTIPFDELLAKGFNTRQTDVRPAKSVSTALQLVAVIFQIQSLQQFGGVSASHLDWSLVPYIRKSFAKHLRNGFKYVMKLPECASRVPEEVAFNDPMACEPCYKEAYDYAMDMTIKETYQAVEGMFHNLNTLQSRSGNQLPFTSINFGTCTLPEGRLVIKAILDTSIKGIGKLHKTSIFPCSIFQCMKGVNQKEGEPNYDLFKLALKSTSLRLYPNYANCNVNMQEDWIAYDRKQKEDYINSLSNEEYNILIQRLEDNVELQNLLMLEVEEVND